jgi:hypothetical protein
MCGEHALHLQPRTTWGFLKRGIARLLDADSRLLRSLYLLLFRPGTLANRFLDGHRSHYVGPLQLFAIVNVAFVLFVGATGGPATFQNPLYYHVNGSYPHQDIAERWVSHRINAPDGWTLEAAQQLEDSLQTDTSTEATASVEPFRPTLDALSRYRDYAQTFNRQADQLAEALVFLFVPVLAAMFWAGAWLTGARPERRRGLASIVQATHFMTVLLILLCATLIPAIGTSFLLYLLGASETGNPEPVLILLLFSFATVYLSLAIRRVGHVSWPYSIVQSVVIVATLFFAQHVYTSLLFFVVYVLTL